MQTLADLGFVVEGVEADSEMAKTVAEDMKTKVHHCRMDTFVESIEEGHRLHSHQGFRDLDLVVVAGTQAVQLIKRHRDAGRRKRDAQLQQLFAHTLSIATELRPAVLLLISPAPREDPQDTDLR